MWLLASRLLDSVHEVRDISLRWNDCLYVLYVTESVWLNSVQMQWQTLYKLVESWRQKEVERQEVVRQLQLEKHTVQEAFESQQQVNWRQAVTVKDVLWRP